ncbi:DNA topoisomerase I [Emticicia oligotrophica DSM 17448]|uniref:DNA topoisomerase 1 n=1 Tax=Emticicia oligotrophica (strain DSM 17448 / CIP 109782 / MTCC 6937 / GPTSA100-15) TaxID=929562 RepID=A0ABM5N6T4_EMTOG|nr:type I DNA topoisomerase [Emticicia oligotrophica]AFK05188.1 DNA topoisomerase I [Emticicia oligotrophica DSM 17448]
MSKNLVIVESPAKAKTIEGYLGKDFTVKSSFGHVRDLPDKELGIDVKNQFEPSYIISSDKTKVINELKKIAKDSETVWLATDDDREGEAISWHLKEALGLNEQTPRIVFREITKKAITTAIQNPRTINMNLVNAQQARRVLDRLVGFELSPVLWHKIRTGERTNLSAGRVQSVAVRVIVDREREIDAHDSKSSFKVVAQFIVDKGKVLNAELPKNFETEAEARAFLEKCRNAIFTIKNLEVKPAKKTPAAPFTTSTLQQEASRKLGFSVLQTMTIAQKLYEAGKISYMRTDSTNLSAEAIEKAKTQIENAYGEKYVKTRQYKTKSESAQEAHEAIRPTDFATEKVEGDRNEQRLYDLIWKRSIASQMADAELERTIATIGISTTNEELVATGEVIKFDGFLKVYLESNDDEDEENKGMLPPLAIGQILDLSIMKATERFSKPPARYTEASLVKKLEEMGIGRPSTYAPTISTIIKRNYVVKEDRPGKERSFKEFTLQKNEIAERIGKETYGSEKAKLFPTNIGMVVNDFLVDNFDSVIDYNFTAKVEKDFDVVADGKAQWQTIISNFYKDFHHKIEQASDVKSTQGSRELGIDPKTGKKVSVKMGKFGPYVQIGDKDDEEKPTFVSLPKGQLMDTLTLEEGLALFDLPKLPKEVGFFEDKPLIVSVGKFGPYIKHDDKFYNLEKTDDPYLIDAQRAIEIIEAKRNSNDLSQPKDLGIYEGLAVNIGKGRFGPYVKHGDKYYNIDKKTDPTSLTIDGAIEIIKAKKAAESNKIIKEFPENTSIQVLNGQYGPYIKAGKRNVKIPKGTDPATLSLEECLKLANG